VCLCVCMSVCLFVCLSVGHTSGRAKTDEPIEMPFTADSRGPKESSVR